ncbi:uncharacterized protein LOC126745710 [Anthonomus grandis grandis]|uniref:uncharacterized protein LOC126745710 n=1 Tax=Anthonomus grandis grandis TaxID=2921223 RepID=UPI00216543F2|nr:uncharacterized protein LOC126745710 [Anthonomus grandis grandis]
MDLFEDKIFKNDVLYMKSLIGRTVKVTTMDDEHFTGTVYVIDPIYKAIVLHTRKSDSTTFDMHMILHHAIKSLDIESELVDEKYLETEPQVVDSEEVTSRKCRVKRWLERMFISVNEVGDYLKIDDHLLIMPPYGLNNCICNSTIVLEKIQNLILSMPDDFQ